MPTFLGQPFNPSWPGTPPGMSKLDTKIWQRFRPENCKDWIRVYYNCRVGTGGPVPEGLKPVEVLMWLMLTMFRIDAVVEKAGEIWLVEVRSNAARSALGSCILYKQLWDLDPGINIPAVSVVVTDNLIPQMKPIFAFNGIRCFEVG